MHRLRTGFTLVELLIIFALLGAFAIGLLATIDPFEQLKKGRDTTTMGVADNVYSALLRVYAAKGTFPWQEAMAGVSLQSPAGMQVILSLIQGGELKTNFPALAGDHLSRIYLTAAADGETVYICFGPESKSFRTGRTDLYGSQGEPLTACGTAACYVCLKGGNGAAPLALGPSGTGDTPPGNPDATPTMTPTRTPTVTPSLTPTGTPVPTPTPGGPSVIHKRVLVIGYNPAEAGTSYADRYFSWNMGGKTAAQLEDDTFAGVRTAFSSFSQNEIQFTIVKKITVTSSPPYPDGFNYSLSSYGTCVSGQPGYNPTACESRKWQFNYAAWLSQNQICKALKDNNADEIWMLSLPYIMAYENFMIGPDPGFSINGPSFVDTACDKHYAVINGTYDRSDLLFHDVAHRVEATMNYLTGKWSGTDRQKYWQDFAFTSLYAGSKPSQPICGNGHFPFNTTTGYDYGNSTSKTTTCPDWNNFPDLQGTTATGGCSLWGCNDPGWQGYWFAAIPRESGEATLTSYSGKPFQFSRNWWHYILTPDEAIAKFKSIQ